MEGDANPFRVRVDCTLYLQIADCGRLALEDWRDRGKGGVRKCGNIYYLLFSQSHHFSPNFGAFQSEKSAKRAKRRGI